MRPASPGNGTGLAEGPQRLPECLRNPWLPSVPFHPVPSPPAGWRGWGCTDSADALTYGFQLLSTLLLCLSNLMFLPPVVLAIRSRYVLEAAVYTFTMFFSTVCSGVSVFSESFHVVGEVLHFPHVLRRSGDACIFTVGGCLQSPCSYAVSPRLCV